MDIGVNESRVSRYWKLPTLKQTERNARYAHEDALYQNTIRMVSNAFLFGLEIEVEGIPDPHIRAEYYPYWSMTADHSLRNHGVEYVSQPLKMPQLEYALDQLNNSLPKNTATFSPRTSVHVHMNVRDLTLSQITNLIILYTAVENVLFNWVGKDRKESVFCIPICDTNYVQMFLDFDRDPREAVANWNKYTALNIHPMQEKGTVEFRHMYGTSDKNILLQWVNFLGCLKNYAKIVTLSQLLKEVYSLNTNSEYEIFLMKVFKEHAHCLLPIDAKRDMAPNISYVKLATVDYTQRNTTTTTTLIGNNAYTLAFDTAGQFRMDNTINVNRPERLGQEQWMPTAILTQQRIQTAADQLQAAAETNTERGR